MLAKKLISNNVSTIKMSDTGSSALLLMEEMKLSHLPVVEGKTFLGLIAEKDIHNFGNADETVEKHKLLLSSAFVYGHQHFYNAIETAVRNRLSIVPVLNEKDEYLGVILLPKLLKKAAELLNIDDFGGLIILQVHKHDYALSEISRIVEDENAQILSFATNVRADGSVFITLKVNTENIGAIIKSFERYGYYVYSYFTNNADETANFESRVDELLHYMSV